MEEAWGWYQETRRQLRLWERMVSRYWDDLPWEGKLGGDDRFRNLDETQLVDASKAALGQIDDLAVLVLFSVFESMIRGRVAAGIRSQMQEKAVDNAVIVLAVDEAVRKVEEGSFHWVLQSFKAVDHNLVEEVNQVRRYRNWVAHGRRGESPAAVEPATAYDRLNRFWQLIGTGSTSPDVS